MVDILKHPLIKQSYEVSRAIEECGCSEKLTAASVKSAALTEAISDYVAQARREGMEEAAKIAENHIGKLMQHMHPGFCPICDKFYAAKAKAEEIAAAIRRASSDAPKLSDFNDPANTRIYSPESPEEK